jgi:hypothetical protein
VEGVEDCTLLSPLTFTVIDTGDSATDLTGTDGSPRYCVTQAAGNPGSTIEFSPDVSGTIPLGSRLELAADVTITGPGPTVLKLAGGGPGSNFSVFLVDINVTTGISGLTIADGHNNTIMRTAAALTTTWAPWLSPTAPSPTIRPATAAAALTPSMAHPPSPTAHSATTRPATAAASFPITARSL